MKKKMCLIWHEAGNKLYQDRFDALADKFELVVIGPEEFMGSKFLADKHDNWKLMLFRSCLKKHWLTYFSLDAIFFIRREKFDVVYIHEEPHSLFSFLLTVFCGSRFTILETSVINRRLNFRGLNFLERFVYSNVDVVFPKNHEVAENLVVRGCSIKKISNPIGNGVSKSTFAEVEKRKAREFFRSSKGLNISDSEFVVGYAGRIWEPKGLSMLARLSREMNCKVVICGSIKDKWVFDELLESGVVYAGSLSKDDLNIFYSALDLFVLPSRSTSFWREQFGRVCAEAIYCGTPAIGSNVGGIPMVVGSDNTFEDGCYEEMLAMIRIYQDEDCRIELLKRQHVHIEENFSWESIANQVFSLISLEG
jgi:glycosyltransferase involved in cell wall biosynthesis